MAVPESKDELLSAIDDSFNKLLLQLSKIPTDRVSEISMEGHAKGTSMSPCNLVSYLIGWNELVIKWLYNDDKGKAVDLPETGFKWNQQGLLAQKFYVDYSQLSWNELIQRLETVKSILIEDISRRSNEELYEMPWYGKWTKGRMIQFNTSSPYSNAKGRISKWLKASAAL